MNKCISNIAGLYIKIVGLLEKFALPVLLLFIRVWMAMIFWYSGLTKLSSWQSTIYLFKDEYKVPIINPELAAYFSVSFELLCPILLVLGFCTRFAAIPLLAMTAVIQFTYLDLIDHRYWAMLLALIICCGGGVLSVDRLVFKRFYS